MSNILLISAPGAGKGVTSKYLKEKYNMVHMSIGNLLREESEKNTSLKEKLKEAASTFESNGYTAQRGFVFASNRPILDNFKNLREITKNCI